ncbi:MAG: hypothetical protein F6K26_39460, partial [Moorea sp. SIO2I5]|nr:hypothetical protein [Moorena sp. SIO2I5]
SRLPTPDSRLPIPSYDFRTGNSPTLLDHNDRQTSAILVNLYYWIQHLWE